MTTKQPEIAELADWRSHRDLGQDVGRILVLDAEVVERGDPQIDLAHLETGDFEAEIEPAEGEVPELLG